MAAQNRALSFTFTTDDQQALAALRRMEKGFKGLDVQVDRTRQSGLNLGSTMGGLALGAGALFSVNEFEEAEAGMRATEAVIKSTGNAAEVSAEQQAELVAELSKIAGVDDDIVNSGANMLRTFTDIEEENFGLALGAAMDYAAFKGQDLATSAEMVGKALNNPLTGMTKLTKAGVVFSDVQKQQVKDFMAVGDIASAQKVILSELEKEYGGQAEAAATSSGKMKVAFGEAAESVGSVLAPAMEIGADAAGFAAEAFGRLPDPLQGAAVGALALAYAGPKAVDGLSKIGPAASRVGDFLGLIPEKGVGAVSTMSKLASTVAASPVAMAAGAAGAGLLVSALVEVAAASDLADKNAKALVSTAESTGKSIDAVFNERLAKTIAGAEGAFDIGPTGDKFGEILEKMGVDSAELGAALRGTDAEFEAFQDRIARTAKDSGSQELAALWVILREQLDRLRGAGEKANTQNKDLAQAQKDLNVETTAGVEATKESATVTAEANDVTKDWYNTNADLAEQFRERIELHDQLNDEMADGIALAYESIDAEMAVKAAHDSVQDAQLALAEAEKTNDPEKIQRARDDLTAAILREVEAADKAAAKAAELSGKSYDAGESARVQKEKLNELAGQTGHTSNEMIWLNAVLDNLMRERQLQLDTLEARENIQKLIDKLIELGGFTGIGGVTSVIGDVLAQAAAAAAAATSGPDGLRAGGDSLRGAPLMNVENLNVGNGVGMRDLRMELRRREDAVARRVLAA